MKEMQETQVRSLGWENPPEEDMATHSSILAWEIPWTEETGGLQSVASQTVGVELSDKARTHTHIHTQSRETNAQFKYILTC